MTSPVRIIPSLLLSGDRLVKGVGYKDYRDAGSPASSARIYDAQGADELSFLDIDASKKGNPPKLDILKAVAAECATPLTFGGGINTLELASAAIAGGADKVSMTTTAFENPTLITQVAERFGRQACMVGVDVFEDGNRLAFYDHRRDECTSASVEEWILEAQRLGAGEIRISFVNREGRRSGFPIDHMRALRKLISVPMIIEGGAGNLDDVDAAFDVEIDGLILGTMLVFSDNNIVQIKRHLEARKRTIRPW
ncbi:MAG: imidazole glycerol phosphate synthase subunit HisF [Rhodospirillaceae bacterium]|nr:imidazole glycerol phosphate synthase subunit HisF [Rhodospirillaceae bacterium]MAX62470.1 imidazole glycerol phosphate synthase subunit HisF [Rhodospirillaceae bacterium]MBB56868.1 imidazole glycerol phosphate synthase subunit HisF [Rhodospirillaceae bacterium]|tara:strand:+ start:49977 stop:50735 length:759 start_codon:yes stop_codon:yes gene_type:complete